MEQQQRKTICHYNSQGHAHFLTFSCYQRLPLLNRERTRRWLIETITEAKGKHNNPVKRGLVLIPQEWRWSSAGWYHGERGIVLAMDDFTL